DSVLEKIPRSNRERSSEGSDDAGARPEEPAVGHGRHAVEGDPSTDEEGKVLVSCLDRARVRHSAGIERGQGSREVFRFLQGRARQHVAVDVTKAGWTILFRPAAVFCIMQLAGR